MEIWSTLPDDSSHFAHFSRFVSQAQAAVNSLADVEEKCSADRADELATLLEHYADILQLNITELTDSIDKRSEEIDVIEANLHKHAPSTVNLNWR